MKKFKILAGTFAVIAALITGLLIFFADAECDIRIIETVTSPDGKYLATALVRDCGATIGFSPQVRLQLAGWPEWSDKKVFWGYHTNDVHVKWTGKSELEIYSNCSKENIYLLKKKFLGVGIKHIQVIPEEIENKNASHLLLSSPHPDLWDTKTK